MTAKAGANHSTTVVSQGARYREIIERYDGKPDRYGRTRHSVTKHEEFVGDSWLRRRRTAMTDHDRNRIFGSKETSA